MRALRQLKVVYLTSGTILIGRFSDMLKVSRISIRGASQAGARFLAFDKSIFAGQKQKSPGFKPDTSYNYVLGKCPGISSYRDSFSLDETTDRRYSSTRKLRNLYMYMISGSKWSPNF